MTLPKMPFKDVEVRGSARQWKLYRAKSGAVGLNILCECYEWRYPLESEWQQFEDESTGERVIYRQWANVFFVQKNGAINADNVRILASLFGWAWQDGVEHGPLDSCLSWISVHDDYWGVPVAKHYGQWDRPAAQADVPVRYVATEDVAAEIGAAYGPTLQSIAAEVEEQPTTTGDAFGVDYNVPF